MTIASGTESQVNTTTTGDQKEPHVIARADGGFTVVWKSSPGWMAVQAYDASGTPIGAENVFFGSATEWAALPDGRLAYAAVSPGPISLLYFGIVNADGSTSLSRQQYIPQFSDYTDTVALKIDGDGHILLASSDDMGAAGLLLNTDGSVSQFLIFGYPDYAPAHAATNVRLAVAPNGGFLAIYDRAEEGVEARYVGADGSLGPEFDLPIPPGAEFIHGDGELTFAWIENDENGNPSVAVGTTDGSSFYAYWAGSTGTTPSDVKLWDLGDGRRLVSWTADGDVDGDGTTLMGQVVEFGRPLGEAFVLNGNPTGDQTAVSIAALGDGRFVASWQTPDIDGDGLGISSRIFDPRSYTGTDDGDRWYGGAFDDTIVAGEGNDTLGGEGGNDSIDAGSGDDRIYGSGGDDSIDGGDGDDRYLVGGTWADWDFEQDGGGGVVVRWHTNAAYGTKTLSNMETIVFGDDSEMALDAIPVNSSPTAVADNNASDPVTEIADPTAQGNVLANDTDPNLSIGDRLSVLSAQFGGNTSIAVDNDGATIAGAYGTLTLLADGDYSYTLDTNSTIVQALGIGDVRDEIFTYTVTDSKGATSASSLTITLSGEDRAPNRAPVANDDTLFIFQRSGPVGGLTANDTDPDGDVLSVHNVGDAVGGSVTLIDGQVYFAFAEGFSGPASFTYSVTDGFTTSGPATVTVSTGASPVVTPPVVTTPIVTTPIVTTPIVITPIVTTPIVITPIVMPPIVTPPTPPIIHDIRLSVYGTSGHDLLDRRTKCMDVRRVVGTRTFTPAGAMTRSKPSAAPTVFAVTPATTGSTATMAKTPLSAAQARICSPAVSMPTRSSSTLSSAHRTSTPSPTSSTTLTSSRSTTGSSPSSRDR
jgi:VCBS repeat-containing protein